MKYDKSGFEDFGPIKEKIPVNDGVMPVSYGFIADTHTKENDEVDVLVFSHQEFKTGDEVEVEVIGIIKRADGDDKVLAVDNSRPEIKSWPDIAEAERQLITDFFSYQHPFLVIEGRVEAENYIKSCSIVK